MKKVFKQCLQEMFQRQPEQVLFANIDPLKKELADNPELSHLAARILRENAATLLGRNGDKK